MHVQQDFYAINSVLHITVKRGKGVKPPIIFFFRLLSLPRHFV